LSSRPGARRIQPSPPPIGGQTETGLPLQFDLYTDQPAYDPIFDRFQGLEVVNHRSKIEAMRRTRSDATVALDSDTLAGTGFDELFSMSRR
jgi:hypothetical protein